MKKEDEYTVLILEAVSDVVNDLNDDLQDGENLTHFFHALMNLAPSLLYNEITGDKVNVLQSNHIANQLVHQYKTNK